MVLGLLTAVAACPAIVGINETVQHGQRQEAKKRHRGRKMNLVVSCSDPSKKSRDVNGAYIVLRNHKLYVSTTKDSRHNEMGHNGHLFQGYFFKHPEHQWGRGGEGLVSTISNDPPMLNWIYVDKDTYEVKYDNKQGSEGHLLGPWNCTPVEKRLTFDGWEGFAVAEEPAGPGENGDEDGMVWALYFDVDDNGLQSKVPLDRRVLEVELTRKEMRIPPAEAEDEEPK
ncbi:hypothetical protein VTO42DRAFT_8718 [Malbranchea cinnamomea]